MRDFLSQLRITTQNAFIIPDNATIRQERRPTVLKITNSSTKSLDSRSCEHEDERDSRESKQTSLDPYHTTLQKRRAPGLPPHHTIDVLPEHKNSRWNASPRGRTKDVSISPVTRETSHSSRPSSLVSTRRRTRRLSSVPSSKKEREEFLHSALSNTREDRTALDIMEEVFSVINSDIPSPETGIRRTCSVW